MRPTIIRRAGPADASALARLRYEFRAAEDEAREPEADFIARCSAWMVEHLEHRGWRCWVAEREGGLIAMIWLSLIDKLPNPVAEPEQHGYVTSFYVQPAARGDGLGSTLLATCLAACDADGMDAVILWPTPRSRPLYARHGFAVRDDIMERRG